jgi:hypothetical protein
MFPRALRFLQVAFGSRFIDIERGLPGLLELRCGWTSTVFEKASARVLQGNRFASTFSTIERIELHQPRGQESPLNWVVALCLQGERQIQVGESTDETEASIVGAKIASITGRPVIVKP